MKKLMIWELNLAKATRFVWFLDEIFTKSLLSNSRVVEVMERLWRKFTTNYSILLNAFLMHGLLLDFQS